METAPPLQIPQHDMMGVGPEHLHLRQMMLPGRTELPSITSSIAVATQVKNLVIMTFIENIQPRHFIALHHLDRTRQVVKGYFVTIGRPHQI